MDPVVRMSPRKTQPALLTEGLEKVYPNGTVALKDFSIQIGRDEFVVIIGLSGAGKSTLLRCINRLVQPTNGRLELFGENISHVGGRRLRQVRQRVGMIFQQFHLVRRLTVLENVMVGRLRFNAAPVRHIMSLLRTLPKTEKESAFECLKQVGIADLAFQRADTLSGGQQQRVAIARALAQDPELFLADEPIASLDPRSSEVVMDTLRDIHETRNIPIIVNLHHIDFAQRYGKRILGMSRGNLVFNGNVKDLTLDAIKNVYGTGSDEALLELAAAGA